jgi:GT2 family glycosyltransferase
VNDAGQPHGAQLDVGVVVVTYNSGGVIGPLLASLPDGLRGLTWQLVVVDNGSSDDTISLVEAGGYEAMALGANLGYAAAINRGLRRFPKARSVLVLNPDVELQPDSVNALMAVLDDDAVGIAAPRVRTPGPAGTQSLTLRRDPSLLSSWATAVFGSGVARRLGLYEALSDPDAYAVEHDVDWAVGAALLCSRRCLDAVGDWDESYFLYSEETDYCHRARLAGFRVRYTPKAVIVHREGSSLVDPKLRSMMSVNRVREYRRRHGAAASWCFYASAVVHETLRSVPGNPAARAAARALVRPSRRPPEIQASTSLLPH